MTRKAVPKVFQTNLKRLKKSLQFWEKFDGILLKMLINLKRISQSNLFSNQFENTNYE